MATVRFSSYTVRGSTERARESLHVKIFLWSTLWEDEGTEAEEGQEEADEALCDLGDIEFHKIMQQEDPKLFGSFRLNSYLE